MRSLYHALTRLKGGLGLITMLLIGNVVSAGSPMDRLVAQAGEPEMTVKLEHTRYASTEFDEYVSDYVVFTYDSGNSDEVNSRKPDVINVIIPTPRGDFDLKLVKTVITSPDFVVESSSGETTIEGQLGTHYRGVVEGYEGSVAAASFIYGQFTVMASTLQHGNFTANAVDDMNRYVSYFDNDLLIDAGFECHTEDPEEVPEFLQNERLREEILNQRQGDEPCLRVHFEADYQLHQNKGNVALTAAYIEGFFNQVALIYANESMNMVLSYIHVWDSPDPFAPQGSSGTALQKFANYIATGANLNGDLGSLVAFDPGGLGGVANGIGGLCLNDAAKLSYSDIDAAFSNFPVFSWTVMVVAHEMGHSIGSPHTHGCYWNGDATQIDDCGNVATAPNHEGNPCYQQFSPIIPAAGGYVMSYCHLNAVGINLALGFGQQSGDLVRTFYNGAACLTPCPEDGCGVVYNLDVTDITETEALVSWYHPLETTFEVIYSDGDNDVTVPVDGASEILLTGLTAGTNYEITVSTVCTTIGSEAVDMDFSTVCSEVFTLPYIELFEGNGWAQNSYELQACWTNILSTDSYGWSVEKGFTGSGNTGPSGDHTSGFGKYVYAEASLGSENDDAGLISPQVDLGAAVGPFATFWYHLYGATLGQLQIEVTNDDGANWFNLETIIGQQQSASTDPWLQSTVDLTAYEGETIRLRFTAQRGADFQGDIAIDDLIITDASLIDISINALTSPVSGCSIGAAEDVIVTVQNSGYQTLIAGTEIELELSLDEAPVATETLTLAVDLDPAQFTIFTFAQTLDLSAAGQYSISVTSNYASDQVSGNNSRGATVVNKPTVSAYPYTQSFESGSDWTSGGAENSWAMGTPAKVIIIGASDGDNAWVTGGLGLGTYNALEESFVEGPCFDFSNLSDATIEFDVWWEIETIWEGATFQSSIDNGQSWQAVGALGANWFNSDTITTLPGIDGWTGTDDGDNSFDGSGGWVTVTHDLDHLAEEPSVFLRMYFLTDPFVQFDGIAFDNITIDGTSIIPACYDITLEAVTCDPGSAGEDVVVFQDINGCDSVVTTMTTLLQSYDILIQDYSCDPGDTGTIVNVFTAQSTCDSIVTERTDLWPSYDYGITVETCDEDEVGVENLALNTINGCDSLVEVTTVLADPYEVLINEASCNPADTGLVETTLVASDGCDSIVTVNTAFTPIEADFSYVENEGVVTFTNNSSNATDFEWTFGDGNTNDTENPTNTYTTNGDYEVVLIASQAGCASDTFIVTVTILASSIDLISFIESVNVFPNPNDGNFAVELRGETVLTDLTFTLFNVAGGTLETREVPFNSFARETYNMENLSNGIYFLRIQSDEEQTTLKINVLR